jgi:monoterpene epsilon-lactone hydrolase
VDLLEPDLPPLSNQTLTKRLIWRFDRATLSRTFGMPYPLGRIAVDLLSYLDPPPRDVDVRKGSVAGRKSRLLVPEGAGESPSLLWLHGGAFCFNSPVAYSTLVAHVAKAMGRSAVIPGYRLAPEHPFPAAPEDALAAYHAVASPGRPMIVGGDSAGAGLALGLAIALRDAGESPPAGLLLMSPWVELTMSGDSIRANDGKDGILRAGALPRLVEAYASGLDPADPRLSPLNADLSGLPPALIQCGGDELFLSEGTELAARLEAAGTDVELQVYEGVWHDFQAHASILAEAATAVQRMAAWAEPLLG